jgi:hypothetical protein
MIVHLKVRNDVLSHLLNRERQEEAGGRYHTRGGAAQLLAGPQEGEGNEGEIQGNHGEGGTERA